MDMHTRVGAFLLVGLFAAPSLASAQVPTAEPSPAAPAAEPAQVAAPAPIPAPAPAARCEMVFAPAALAAGSQQQLAVTLKISDGAELDPGQIATLESPEESGLQLARVEGEGLQVAVNASAAKAGAWQVEAFAPSAGAEAQDPLCVGTLTVQ